MSGCKALGWRVILGSGWLGLASNADIPLRLENFAHGRIPKNLVVFESVSLSIYLFNF